MESDARTSVPPPLRAFPTVGVSPSIDVGLNLTVSLYRSARLASDVESVVPDRLTKPDPPWGWPEMSWGTNCEDLKEEKEVLVPLKYQHTSSRSSLPTHKNTR